MSHSKRGAGSGKATHGNHHFDLNGAARRAVVEAGFEVDLDADAKAQAARISGPAPIDPQVKDLRDRPWSSIDNKESRDLDQIELAERLPDGSIRLVVGIADVDVLVPKDSPLDKHAFANCTSVYTGVEVFPMLPENLSTDAT